MRAGTRLNLLKERVVESDSAEKVGRVARDVAESTCNIAGYLAWRLGKSLRLRKLRDALKRDMQEYKDELNNEKE